MSRSASPFYRALRLFSVLGVAGVFALFRHHLPLFCQDFVLKVFRFVLFTYCLFALRELLIRLADGMGYGTSQKLREKQTEESRKNEDLRAWFKSDPKRKRPLWLFLIFFLQLGLVVWNTPAERLVGGRLQLDQISPSFRFWLMAMSVTITHCAAIWIGRSWSRTALGRVLFVAFPAIAVVLCFILPVFDSNSLEGAFSVFFLLELIVPLVYFFSFVRWSRSQALPPTP